jgi:hypothetical protein
MARRLGWDRLLTVLFCLALAGCNVGRPNWFQPGSIDQQQQRAVIHDPYTDNDLATPVVGGRPRDFQQPASEATRTQPWKYWYGQ